MAGRYNTQWVEQSMRLTNDEAAGDSAEAAAIAATLVEHLQRQHALQFSVVPNRNASHWKWSERR